jgi:sugar lactone lactonase YvrE
MTKTLFIIGSVLLHLHCIAQAPNILYAGPQTYSVGTTITPLTPTNTGGAVPARIYGQVTTIAGSGIQGATDETGTAASFSYPKGVTVDVSGNIYIADNYNHKIRKISPAGVVSTLAGNGTAGATNATGTAASFSSPMGLTVDAAGNVYVADSANHKIRKITPTGIVTTLAGTGSTGWTDATGTSASFDAPSGVTVDPSGNIYVADTYNHKIRKITPTGVVTTFAGGNISGWTNGTGTAARFDSPIGATMDISGNLYIGEYGNNEIRKITPAKVVTTLAGGLMSGSNNGTGSAASFDRPMGVAVDASGNVYIADSANYLIRKITTAGVVTTLAGSSDNLGSIDAIGTAAKFYRPIGVAVDASGNVYVADTNNHKIRKISIWGYEISPPLPAGLTFNGATGVISGTPTSITTQTTYTISAYNASGTSSATVVIGTSTLGTTSFDKKEFVCYPNPTKNILKIYNAVALIGKDYTITDISGKEVLNSTITNENGIDVSTLSNGLYILIIRDSFSYKFVKE